ncbi:uncharacterized protein LOC121380369 [Gigantopelta aegis]|uniref:uncharacterized protein LOC121380369 n=1 Tax=Gigantopelta aegis TaxID=1735272 RepID=UPI001B88806D|nr:uncharacterized protein LOC121380369 [Gigantopelta aegis]
MEPTLVVFVVLIAQCTISSTYGQNQACPPIQCPRGYYMNVMICNCVISGVGGMGRPNTAMMQGISNIAAMRRMSATTAPQQGSQGWTVSPAMMALAGGNERLSNALIMGANKATRAPLPNAAPRMGPAPPSQYPLGGNPSISPLLLSNSDMAESLAMHSLMTGRRGGQMGLAQTLALTRGSDAVRDAMLINAAYPNNGMGASMMLLGGSDAARDAYIINSLNRRGGGQASYLNTLGATGALGDNYRDMLATKAVLQETNPIKQSMLSKVLDIPDSTRQLIMLRAFQGQRQTMLY